MGLSQLLSSIAVSQHHLAWQLGKSVLNTKLMDFCLNNLLTLSYQNNWTKIHHVTQQESLQKRLDTYNVSLNVKQIKWSTFSWQQLQHFLSQWTQCVSKETVNTNQQQPKINLVHPQVKLGLFLGESLREYTIVQLVCFH